MEYLVRKRGTGKAHYWLGLDTVCKMASSGGLNLKRYKLETYAGRAVCHMCKVVAERDGISAM